MVSYLRGRGGGGKDDSVRQSRNLETPSVRDSDSLVRHPAPDLLRTIRQKHRLSNILKKKRTINLDKNSWPVVVPAMSKQETGA